MKKVRSLRNLIGNQLDVHSCWMLTRSLETLRLRMDKAFANAERVAQWLAPGPRVETRRLSRSGAAPARGPRR